MIRRKESVKASWRWEEKRAKRGTSLTTNKWIELSSEFTSFTSLIQRFEMVVEVFMRPRHPQVNIGEVVTWFQMIVVAIERGSTSGSGLGRKIASSPALTHLRANLENINKNLSFSNVSSLFCLFHFSCFVSLLQFTTFFLSLNGGAAGEGGRCSI